MQATREPQIYERQAHPSTMLNLRYSPMRGDARERWQRLCEQAVVEQDPERLIELTSEITRLLEEKEKRLRSQKESKPTAGKVSSPT